LRGLSIVPVCRLPVRVMVFLRKGAGRYSGMRRGRIPSRGWSAGFRPGGV